MRPVTLRVFFALFAFCLLVRLGEAESIEFLHENIARVAVIGAGAGGSSAAYFLRQFGGNEIDIEVFERTGVVGGRVQSADFSGEHTELGGSIYHKENKLFSDFVRLGKFETFDPIHGHTDPKAKPPIGFIPENHRMGIWNGKEFVFQEGESFLMNVVFGLWRYGFDAKYVNKESDRILHKFLKIYNLLDQQTFNSVEELLDALELRNLTAVTLEDHLLNNNFCGYNNGTYCHDIVTGLTRVNYGQSMKLNALVGLIALVGSSDDILGVVGGNYKVLEYALWRAKALVRYNSPVTRISKETGNHSKYSISYLDEDENEKIVDGFDKVIIATPLEFAGIEFEGFSLPSKGMQKRPYQLTHVSIIVGELNLGGYFGLSDSHEPQMIMTTEDPRAEFSSIFLHSDYNAKGEIRKLYKVFSRSRLSDDKLGEIFTNITSKFQTEFYAYPVLDPLPKDVPFPPIVLDDSSVFYVNAMESAFSTIETEIISGKNIAQLVVNSFDNH